MTSSPPLHGGLNYPSYNTRWECAILYKFDHKNFKALFSIAHFRVLGDE